MPVKAAAESPVPAKRRLSFGAIVPVLVLLLAAGIFLGITGGWTSWVGGNSAAAQRRAVRRGDAWHPLRFAAGWARLPATT